MKVHPQLNLTLAAFYGRKPSGLAHLLGGIQAELIKELGVAYHPLEPGQVHATIIGLEGRRTRTGVLNTNLENTGIFPDAMDLDGLLSFFRKTPLLPLHVRIGGFRHAAGYPFTSRGQHPCMRSFAFQGSAAVVVGWPVMNGGYPMSLDRLRRQCMEYNVLHKYHQAADAIDNDLFLVLGHADAIPESRGKIDVAQNRIRNLLSSLEPLDVLLDQETLSLPIQSSIVYTIDEALHGIEELIAQYGQV